MGEMQSRGIRVDGWGKKVEIVKNVRDKYEMTFEFLHDLLELDSQTHITGVSVNPERDLINVHVIIDEVEGYVGPPVAAQITEPSRLLGKSKFSGE